MTRGATLPAFCLETGVEADQEGMIRCLLKDVLFRLDPVNVLEEKQLPSTVSVKGHFEIVP